MSSCIQSNDDKIRAEIEEYSAKFSGESFNTVANALGIWWEKNPNRQGEHPPVEELTSFMRGMRSSDNNTISTEDPIKSITPVNTNTYTINYTPNGKSEQTYIIKGDKIYNKQGKEVYKSNSANRYAIFAKLAVKQRRAVVIDYEGAKYIVNNRNQILSVTTRKLMKWGEENEDRKAIIKLATDKFSKLSKPLVTFSTSESGSYVIRTEENIDQSDITLAFAEDFSTAGETLTAQLAGSTDPKYLGNRSQLRSKKDKYVPISLKGDLTYVVDEILDTINKKQLPTKDIKLNIAGNGIYTLTKYGYTQEDLNSSIANIIQGLLEKGVTISEIRSGGQTGVDEAGIMAAQKLGIPSIVHTTSDFKFRGADNKDIKGNEAAFKERFFPSSTNKQKVVTTNSATNSNKLGPIEEYNGKWSREEVTKDTESLYIFTDNTDRDSGSNLIDSNSNYAKRHGDNKHYPTMTQAVIRGLDNAMPISTQRWYHDGAKGESGRWADDDFDEFKQVIDEEIEDIKREWNSGKYKRIVVGSIDGFFNTRISNISLERTPKLYNYLKSKLAEIGVSQEAEQGAQILDDALMPPSISEAPTMESPEEEFNDNIFNDISVSTTAEQRALDYEFDPTVRMDRVNLISRLFSEELSLAVEEETNRIEKELGNKDLSNERRQALTDQLYSLSRENILDIYAPVGIFNRVRGIFEDYVEGSEDERIQVELAKINAFEQELINSGEIEESERYSDEEKLSSAKRKASYKAQEYQKILDYFEPLAEEASNLLVLSEGIVINSKYSVSDDPNFNSDDPEGNSFLDNNSDDVLSKEEKVKDGWMTNFRHVSAHESLSKAVRKVINQIPKLDYQGYLDEDDLGNIRYLNADYVHAALIDKLRFMSTAEDMIPLLEKLQETQPWVEEIIEKLKEDDVLFSQFYQDFRKDFIEYWVQRKIMNPDGSFKVKTIAVNRPNGVYYLFEEWRYNYESGNILDDNSIYGKNRVLNKENAKVGLKTFNELNNLFQQTNSSKQRLELLDTEEVWNKLLKMFRMIGINPNSDILEIALKNTSENENLIDPIMLLLPNFQIIFKGVLKGEVEDEILEDGTTEVGDLINTFGSAYNSIAMTIAEVTEDAIESSVRENDKSYYSHIVPSYLGKLMKQLQNVLDNEEKFNEFIEKEFKQYEFFYDKKNDRWLNSWIEQLVNDPKMRKALKHKVVLNHEKQEYTNWDEITYTIVMLNEYWSEPKEGMAWYHVSMLSDAPSAEFVRFTRYTTGEEKGSYGKVKTYQEKILDKLVDKVMQEYNRIMLVKARAAIYAQGGKITPIANYDMTFDNETGKVKNIGGAEFKFLPDLNNYYDKGKLFIDKLSELYDKKDPVALVKFIRSALTNIMEKGFEDTYADWHKMGLLDEDSNGRFKYIPFKAQSETNARVVAALRAARDILKEGFKKEFEDLITKYENNEPVVDKEAEKVFKYLIDSLNTEVARENLSKEEAEKITRNLTTKNNSKDALREYYWNSKLATAELIQLTTTDLAFYKNVEDFQKRFKEIHAPSLRLNTLATFHGEKVGRIWEKTIYLKDDEVISTVSKDIEEIFLNKYKDGEISELDAATVISKYGNYNIEKNGKKYYKVGSTMVETSYINVADAQAYRSISSYRAMMVMSGQWDDKMELAYKHLTDKNAKWTMEDFYTIWQPKKPFVYTQINNDSGVEGHTGIKTPVQHKNSEFLLLAMHDAVAGPLGKSAKLRAINTFMEKHQIDVVQFESTTKVGKQGVIDINDEAVKEEQELLKKEGKSYSEEAAINSILEKATGVLSGTENPNVVHKISYEDYGIQTQTPEHVIDRTQLIGTQIRKLIAADIPNNATFTIGDKTLTKEEWFKLYNELNTENIIQAFVEVDKIFSDKREIERVLQEEMRGNPRYSEELRRACRLDENGNFTIPLYDPIQSQRIQTLLNSVIKSRITKQKIKGGSLIQVSSYGLSEKLKIKFTGEGKSKAIEYVECYMPAYSKDFYAPYMGDDGLLHVDDWVDSKGIKHKGLPEELKKLIGYRVPTEGKYSMLPLKIKGFLPQQNGSCIMLPEEITTISGSDFDIDKLYIMLPEFKVVKYDYDKARRAFNGSDEVIDQLSSIFKNDKTGTFAALEDTPLEFREWFEKNKEDYPLDTPIIYPIKYNYNKPAHKQSLEARNNALLDMMWSVLTHPDTASQLLNPGGFDLQKTAARIVTILEGTNIYSYETLAKLPLKELNKLADKYKIKLDPLSPRTHVILHQQNMTGAKMIGIYANHNANHAIIQYTNLSLNPKVSTFTFAGKTLFALNHIKNDRGMYISVNNANYLAASVDNVKDNTLYATNQNTFTGDVTMLLSRLGYTPTEIAILLKQPIILDIVRTYFRYIRDGKSKETIIDDVIKKYSESAGRDKVLTFDEVKGKNKFELDVLSKDLYKGKIIEDLDEKEKIDFYRRQTAVGVLFKQIFSGATALSDLVGATRSDTSNGGAGPTIAETSIKLSKIDDYLKSKGSSKPILLGENIISDLITEADFKDINSLREKLLKYSDVPYMEAFYTLGLRATEYLMEKYFPHFTPGFKQVVDTLRKMTKTERLDVKTLNSIYNDLLVYIMSKESFFGDSKDVLSRERRDWFITKFPKYFEKIVAENPDIAKLEFIQRLKVIPKGIRKSPVDILVFKNVGMLSPALRERYTRDWAALLHMKNPEANRLARALFLYNYYRNGFAFGPSTFNHLAPVAIRESIPRYIEALRELVDNPSQDSYEEFIDQYILNHLDNRKLVPEITNKSSFDFTEDSGVITLAVSKNSSYEDKKIVRKVSKDETGQEIYEFFSFIGTKIDNKWHYYKLVGSNLSGIAQYVRVDPLGMKNNFIEYEYGNKGISSVIPEYEVNTNEETSASFVEDPTLEDSDRNVLESMIGDEASYYNSLAQEYATTAVFGENAISEPSSDGLLNIDDLPRNDDYKDANDDDICSGEIIMVL